jgi:hypothetical protein
LRFFITATPEGIEARHAGAEVEEGEVVGFSAGRVLLLTA